MNANGIHDRDNDQHGDTCFEEGHIFGCPGAAGGDHLIEDADGYLRSPLTYEIVEPWTNREGDPHLNGAFGG